MAKFCPHFPKNWTISRVAGQIFVLLFLCVVCVVNTRRKTLSSINVWFLPFLPSPHFPAPPENKQQYLLQELFLSAHINLALSMHLVFVLMLVSQYGECGLDITQGLFVCFSCVNRF